MKIDLNDPRLTAYALEEMDEGERLAFEAELQSFPAGQQAVEEIRQAAKLLREELQIEPAPTLPPERLATVMKKIEPGKKATSVRRLYVAGALLAAASLTLVVYLSWSQRGTSLDNAFDTDQNGNLIGISNAPAGRPVLVRPIQNSRNGPSEPRSGGATDNASLQNRIRGSVKDSAGAAISGAAVTIKTPGSSKESRIITDASGQFQAENLAPGPVEVSVGSPGFKSFTRQLQVPVTGDVSLDAKLEVGEVAQMVNVEAPAAVLPPPATPAAPSSILTSGFAGDLMGVDKNRAINGRFRFAPAANKPVGTRKLFGYVGSQESGDWERPPQPLSEPQRYVDEFNTEAYDRVVDNPFLKVAQNPLSTFSIDVDTAAYANLRRFLTTGTVPPKDSVRIEEMVNYFAYDYPASSGKDPFSANVEVSQAPWNMEHRLVRIALKGREVALERRPPSNLVFLIDVSGSMQPANKLPLLKKGLQLLVEKLNENDRVAIVVYAGASGLALPSTSCEQKSKIMAALENLEAGGSTNGGAGIQLAYDTAIGNFIKGGINRVILATDGDFNVGTTNQGDLIRLIEQKAKSGVFLSVLGFGMGNYKDSMLEKLADKGNGNYAYVDSISEARKVLVEQMGSTLITIAKDVKIQVEFNPAIAGAYRLIGYENRLLRAEDFNDDTKDAGEIGAGHTVTALYEVVPAGKEMNLPGVDALKYQKPVQTSTASNSRELLTVKLRYKEPDSDTSKLLQFPATDRGARWTSASRDFKFASAVAAFGMILRDSPYKGTVTLSSVLELAEEGKGPDKQGYRTEFIDLVKRARALTEGTKITQ